jgi:hypothetical protein
MSDTKTAGFYIMENVRKYKPTDDLDRWQKVCDELDKHGFLGGADIPFSIETYEDIIKSMELIDKEYPEELWTWDLKLTEKVRNAAWTMPQEAQNIYFEYAHSTLRNIFKSGVPIKQAYEITLKIWDPERFKHDLIRAGFIKGPKPLPYKPLTPEEQKKQDEFKDEITKMLIEKSVQIKGETK